MEWCSSFEIQFLQQTKEHRWMIEQQHTHIHFIICMFRVFFYSVRHITINLLTHTSTDIIRSLPLWINFLYFPSFHRAFFLSFWFWCDFLADTSLISVCQIMNNVHLFSTEINYKRCTFRTQGTRKHTIHTNTRIWQRILCKRIYFSKPIYYSNMWNDDAIELLSHILISWY